MPIDLGKSQMEKLARWVVHTIYPFRNRLHLLRLTQCGPNFICYLPMQEVGRLLLTAPEGNPKHLAEIGTPAMPHYVVGCIETEVNESLLKEAG